MACDIIKSIAILKTPLFLYIKGCANFRAKQGSWTKTILQDMWRMALTLQKDQDFCPLRRGENIPQLQFLALNDLRSYIKWTKSTSGFFHRGSSHISLYVEYKRTASQTSVTLRLSLRASWSAFHPSSDWQKTTLAWNLSPLLNSNMPLFTANPLTFLQNNGWQNFTHRQVALCNISATSSSEKASSGLQSSRKEKTNWWHMSAFFHSLNTLVILFI